jgi:signal transduction histidine kinase
LLGDRVPKFTTIAESERGVSAIVLFVTAALVCATAWGGIELTRVSGRIADIWIANSIFLAALLKHDRRDWWKILLAGTLGNMTADFAVGDSVLGTCAFSFANLVEILAVALPLRMLQVDRDIARPKSLLIFYPLAAVAPVFGAAVAATYFHFALAMQYLASAKSWYCADTLGLFIVAPMLMTVRLKALKQMFSRGHIGVTALLLATVAGTIILNFWLWDYPLAFLFFPAVMLLTFQRSFEGGAVGLAMVSGYLMAPIFLHGLFGKVHSQPLAEQMMILQIFIAVIGFSVMLAGAALEERRRLERGLASALTRVEMSREEALVARDAAEKANRAKSMFLANMSHELRTPLNAVIGFAEVMHNEMFGPLGDTHYREYTGMIHDAGRHLLDLINDVLDMSKIEAGKFEIERETVGIGSLVLDCVELMRERADTAGISLSADVPTAPTWAYVDRRAIKQVLFNLLSNAIKFTPSGGQVTARAAQAGGAVILSVTDSGIGIPADQLTRLGNPFVQLRNHAGTSHVGTGLGLALVRSLVELHQGSFQIESAEGVGTTVTVRVSAAQAAGLAA